MATETRQEPLFRSAAPDGKTVMLLVGQDGAWTITYDGKPVEDGRGEGLKIAAAVRRFQALVRPVRDTRETKKV